MEDFAALQVKDRVAGLLIRRCFSRRLEWGGFWKRDACEMAE